MAKQVKVLATKPDHLFNSSDQPGREKELFSHVFLWPPHVHRDTQTNDILHSINVLLLVYCYT